MLGEFWQVVGIFTALSCATELLNPLIVIKLFQLFNKLSKD